jgi:hypothetical protein
MEDWCEDRIGAAERGVNPMVLVQMTSGFAVIWEPADLRSGPGWLYADDHWSGVQSQYDDAVHGEFTVPHHWSLTPAFARCRLNRLAGGN